MFNKYDYISHNRNDSTSYKGTPPSDMQARVQTLAELAALTLQVEGTWSDDPRDLGGETKWGIATVFYPEARDVDFSLKDALVIYEEIAQKTRTLDLVALGMPRTTAYRHFLMGMHIGGRRAIAVPRS